MSAISTAVRFSMAGHHVAVEADAALSSAVADRLGPYAAVEPDAGPARWTVRCGSDATGVASDAECVVVPWVGDQGAVLWVDHDERCITVAPTTEPELAARLAARYALVLLRLSIAESPAQLWLHAGMVVAARPQAPGAVVLGHRQAGRTSTLLAAMMSGWALVGDDAVSLTRSGNGWVGHGSPGAVPVRWDTARALGLAIDRARADVVGEAVALSPTKLSALVGAPAVQPTASVAVLVFPRFTGYSPPALCRLRPSDVLRRLGAELRDPWPRHAEFLLPHFSLPDQASVDACCAVLAEEVPAFALTQSLHDLRVGARQVIRLLE